MHRDREIPPTGVGGYELRVGIIVKLFRLWTVVFIF